MKMKMRDKTINVIHILGGLLLILKVCDAGVSHIARNSYLSLYRASYQSVGIPAQITFLSHACQVYLVHASMSLMTHARNAIVTVACEIAGLARFHRSNCATHEDASVTAYDCEQAPHVVMRTRGGATNFEDDEVEKMRRQKWGDDFCVVFWSPTLPTVDFEVKHHVIELCCAA